MKVLLGSITLFSALLFFASSCGHSSGDSAEPGTLVSIPNSVSASPAQQLLNTSLGLDLATVADSLQVSVTGCATGWTTTCTGSSFDVYLNDKNCVAKLVTFTSGGKTYNQTSACSTIDWQAGASCSFVNASNANDVVNIAVLKQLSNPTVGTDSVSFEWGGVAQGTAQQFLARTLGFPVTDSLISQPAPNFQISQLAYYGVNNDGTGKFGFNLSCGNKMTIDSTNTTQGITLCDNVKLSSLDYAMVALPSGALTASVLEGLMSHTTPNVIAWQTGTNTEKLTSGNGGFMTKVMNGSSKMATNSPMILILRETNLVSSVPIKSYTTYQISFQMLSGCNGSNVTGNGGDGCN